MRSSASRIVSWTCMGTNSNHNEFIGDGLGFRVCGKSKYNLKIFAHSVTGIAIPESRGGLFDNMGRVQLGRGRSHRLILPQSLKDEVADVDQDRFGAEASSVRGLKRGKSRKEIRQQQRLQKKQRRAQYNERLRRKPTPKSAAVGNASDDDSDDDEDVMEPIEDDDIVEVVQKPPPKKKRSKAMEEIDQEIFELEKKLGGDGDKLRRELDDDGLLDLYDAVDGVLSSGAAAAD
ncbi:hypothetical protein BVRB_022780, partial [Beta vulgaris subsp. vulgaris]